MQILLSEPMQRRRGRRRRPRQVARPAGVLPAAEIKACGRIETLRTTARHAEATRLLDRRSATDGWPCRAEAGHVGGFGNKSTGGRKRMGSRAWCDGGVCMTPPAVSIGTPGSVFGTASSAEL